MPLVYPVFILFYLEYLCETESVTEDWAQWIINDAGWMNPCSLARTG